MDEFELIKDYFQKLTKNNLSALKLNDDVFFDKKNKLVLSIDTYNEGVHYLDFKYPDLLIKKILRSSISDENTIISAMRSTLMFSRITGALFVIGFLIGY